MQEPCGALDPAVASSVRRFVKWRAPALAVAVFAVTFSISAFVIGPAISSYDAVKCNATGRHAEPAEHSAHHSN